MNAPHPVSSSAPRRKVLWLFAHPEPRSLNASLRDEGLHTLKELGHDVQESDLYAMGWNPVVTAADFARDPAGRLRVGDASERAHATGRLSDDILAEQRKLAWADTVVLQFPLWWHGPPAILKGWFDRVLVQGFAFGLTDGEGRPRRYGDGGLAGKRALAITTVGARPTGFGPRGIHGDAEEVLFPLLHGTLWYTGMDVLPPLVVPGADRLDADGYTDASAELRERLRTLSTAEPIPYRSERGGDYGSDLTLRPGLAPGGTGLTIHRHDRPAGPARVPARPVTSRGRA
ncbi:MULTISPECIES: NAD(P)H-dependent oxidoreductase [Actinomadura]|uniref:NAD(P)H-dependent oxidoreductase n=1 Tax=Actinomadura yumaensis TaxID=111807 RepID=A0ABW2CII7_9ACTN|nr:NAD(P)H-dependent oxidoreductase [Actinomadura sp. J1-007]MWK40081.1 flavodoxin family protein [Actinomadura sp. J1-007]